MASTPSGLSMGASGPSGASSEVTSTVERSTLPVTPVARSAPPSPVKKSKPKRPVTVADAITAGKNLRWQKTKMPLRSARLPPKPTYPRGMVPTDRDVKMTRRDRLRQARCLRKHNIVLSDRLDELSKPTRRQLIELWRNYADILTPEQINNLQNLLDAADPFKPDQAYEYFIHLRKQKRRAHEKETGGKEKKKQLSALCGDRRFAWVRCATVAFARGIQRRLGRPGTFELEGGMLRLSDIVLDEICSYSKMKPPSRCSNHPKAKFMCEMADKIAVWIDEILAESDERLLMMDFDEDDGSSTSGSSTNVAKHGPDDAGPSAASKPAADADAAPRMSATPAPGTAAPADISAASGTAVSKTSATPASPATSGTALSATPTVTPAEATAPDTAASTAPATQPPPPPQ